MLFHETSQNCDVSTVGDLFGRSGYGIGMPKGSPWSNEISLAVLHFHESGAMEELESEWINFGNCQSDSNSPTTLGLQHMLGKSITSHIAMSCSDHNSVLSELNRTFNI